MSERRSTFANRAALAALGEAAAGATGSVVCTKTATANCFDQSCLAETHALMISILALYPLDTTRTIMQVRTPPYDKPMPFIKLLVHIARTEGWERLYRGLGSAISGAGLSWALYFAWNEFFKRWLLAAKRRTNKNARLGAPEEMLAAAAAGILTTVIVNPIWVINTRQEVTAEGRLKLAAKRRLELKEHQANGNGHAPHCNGSNGHASGPAEEGARKVGRARTPGKGGIGALVELIQKEGLAGYLSGIVPAIIVLVNPAIQLAVYGRLRTAIKRRTGNAPSATQAFVMGAVAKGMAVLVTFPAQTVKLRMQAGLNKDQALDRERLVRELRECKSVWEALRSVSTLWTGVGNKMVTSMLHSALMFAIVELFRALNGSIAKSMKQKRVGA